MATRPTILFHTDCAWFAGCENMLLTLLTSAELRDRYDVHFSYRLSSRYQRELLQRVTPDFPTYPVSVQEIHDFSGLPVAVPHLLRRIYFFAARLVGTLPLFLAEVLYFRRLMRRIRPSIVHVNSGGYPAALSGRAAVVAARRAGVPGVVMVVNNMAVGYTTLFRVLDYPIDRLVARSVGRFVTGSKAAAARLREVLRLPEGQALSIPNGIPYRAATASVEETRRVLGLETFDGVIFGAVGVMGPRKGHEILIRAAAQLAASMGRDVPAFKIVFAGEGELRDSLERLAGELGMANHCLFIGERFDIMNYMEVFDALVLPSLRNEDFPFVVIEAMSHAKPVIASRVAGTVEQVVDGETGILVDPGDVLQLVAAMRELASSRDLRGSMGAAGYRYFRERFTSEVAVKNYASLYASLLA